MREFPSVKIREIDLKDCKSELIQFFSDLEHEPADAAMLAKIQYKKESFKQMLKSSQLNYLFGDFEKTRYEWQCYFDLLNMLCAFDQAIEQCKRSLGYGFDEQEQLLKDKMHVWYSEEY